MRNRAIDDFVKFLCVHIFNRYTGINDINQTISSSISYSTVKIIEIHQWLEFISPVYFRANVIPTRIYTCTSVIELPFVWVLVQLHNPNSMECILSGFWFIFSWVIIYVDTWTMRVKNEQLYLNVNIIPYSAQEL